MIRQLLGNTPPGPVTVLASRLGKPWCWPADPDLAGRAARIARPPADPAPGHTVVVSLEPAVLWEVGPGLPRRVAYTGHAADVAWEAERRALAALPLTPRLDRLRVRVRMGLDVLVAESQPPAAIDGGSHGLALVLAHVSYRLDEPVPVDVMALAGIDPRGAVVPVGGLADKLRVVEQDALAVRRVLVHPAQVHQVEGGLEAVPVKTVREAVAAIYPDVRERVLARLRAHPADAPRLAEQLRRMVLSTGSGVAHWQMIADTAECLLEIAQDPAVREDAELARAIALRHEGHRVVLPRAFASVRLAGERELRLRLLAQWVQSHTDGDASDEAIRAAAREAREHVAPSGERTQVDAMVLGAIGRAWASAGDFEAARVVLRSAVDFWLGTGLDSEGSHAVCEFLRVAALLGDDAGVDEGCAWAEQVAAHLQTSQMSRGFLGVAQIRALALRGRSAEARAVGAELQDLPWASLPSHLAGSLERWQARTLDALGRPHQADELRKRIVHAESKALAALDRCLRDGTSPDALLGDLAGEEGTKAKEFRRLLARRPPGASELGWIVDQYRY